MVNLNARVPNDNLKSPIKITMNPRVKRPNEISTALRCLRVGGLLYIALLLFVPSTSIADIPSPEVSGDKITTPANQLRPPVPQNRGFWGTFFFWSGGVFCMYLVGRRVFKEQAGERKTLKRLRDEIGHFFVEFNPVNITKWVEIAAPHLYHGWREEDFSSMESFTTADFITDQQTHSGERQSLSHKREAYLDKIIAVHTLELIWSQDEERGVERPPLGVRMTLRVEVKAIDFVEDQNGNLVNGKRKPEQHQQVWKLIHNGKTWMLDQVYPAMTDLTELNDAERLPPIGMWQRPDPAVEHPST